jgi:membrane peptidoglycan carboxypeptidase
MPAENGEPIQPTWPELLEFTPMRLERPAQSVPAAVPDPRTPVPDPLTPLPALPDVGPGKITPVPAVALAPLVAKPVYPPARLGVRGPLSGSAAWRRRWRRKVLLRHYSRKHIRAARAREHRARRRTWTMIASSLLSLLLIFLSLGSATAYVANRFVAVTQSTFDPRLMTIHDLLPPDNLKIYDSTGILLDQLTDNGIHTTITYDQIAPVLRNATVATEDKNFWSNEGVDPLGIIRAFLTNLQDGRVVEGGSTISQQLIKNLIVGNAPTIVRKLEEIVLAPQLNSSYSKQDILAMYLNTIYYGHQAYGIDAAANVYFGLRDTPDHAAASQLDLAQAAMLAGLPSNPALYDPVVNFQGATNRFEDVLSLMHDQGYITNIQRYDAMREEQGPHFFSMGAALVNRAPHFVNQVLDQLQQMFHLRQRGDLSRSGLVVYTTLDITLQDKIQKIMQAHIAELSNTHHVTNAAEVLIDFHTGAVLSLLGSIDYYNNAIDGQFDVTQAYRQPGSSFKPYVYVTAFSEGASPAQAIDDKQTSFPVPGSNPPVFTPSNYDQRFHGHMTLRCALQNSLNVPGVIVLSHAGVSNALQTAESMGITSYQGTPGLSMVLGGLGIRLIDHTSAMGTFADGGVHVPYYLINEVVKGTTGQVLFQHQQDTGVQVISPQLAYMMTNVLSDNTDRIPEFFDCNVLQLYANSQQDCWNGNRGVVRPAAAKTGTTNDFKDNWTVGYTTDFVMGVWAGNDDGSPMINVSGITGAAPIWHDAMLLAEQGHPIQDFTNPGGLVRATVTYPDGVETTDWFLPGTVPTFTSSPAPTPTPGAGVTPTPVPTAPPNPANPPASGEPAPAPYCPSYSFAFPPPPDNAQSPGPGWW